jgi:CspA family cold shock protein
MKALRKEAIRLKGKIKRIIRLRDFGFISAENGEEVFFHRSALQGEDFDALQEGTSVEFNLTRGPKGPRAVRVTVAK